MINRWRNWKGVWAQIFRDSIVDVGQSGMVQVWSGPKNSLHIIQTSRWYDIDDSEFRSTNIICTIVFVCIIYLLPFWFTLLATLIRYLFACSDSCYILSPPKDTFQLLFFSSTKMPLPKTPHDRQFPDSFCHCGESFVALVEKTTGDLYVHLMNIWWTFDVKDRSLVLPAQISKNCPSSCSFWSRSPNSYQTPTRTAKWHHPTPLDICSRQN